MALHREGNTSDLPPPPTPPHPKKWRALSLIRVRRKKVNEAATRFKNGVVWGEGDHTPHPHAPLPPTACGNLPSLPLPPPLTVAGVILETISRAVVEEHAPAPPRVPTIPSALPLGVDCPRIEAAVRELHQNTLAERRPVPDGQSRRRIRRNAARHVTPQGRGRYTAPTRNKSRATLTQHNTLPNTRPAPILPSPPTPIVDHNRRWIRTDRTSRLWIMTDQGS